MSVQVENSQLSTANTQRIEWIDICKGLGILTVILGHKAIMFSYIYSFHMPLFFLISGYLFSYKKYKSLNEFIIAKAKTLLVPYLIFSLISIFIMFMRSGAGGITETFSWAQCFREMILSKRNVISYNGSLWFLTSLFTVEILFYILTKYVKKDIIITLVVLLLGYIGCTILQAPASAHTLPWSLDASMYYIVFFAVGYFMKLGKLKIPNKFRFCAFIMCLFISTSLIFNWDTINLVFANRLGLPGGLYILFKEICISISGVYTAIYISKRLGKSKKLSYIGKNSLIIFALHIPIGFFVVEKVLFLLNIQSLTASIIAFSYTIGSILTLIPVISIIHKYAPFIISGNLKNIKRVDKVAGNELEF